MKKPSSNTIKKYVVAIKNSKRRYVNSDDLSQIVGIYPDIIREAFSYYDPMVNMDLEYNLVDLIPVIEKGDTKKKVGHKKVNKKVDNKKKEVKLPYKSINDFVYSKMTFGGMFDKNVSLSDDDLTILKALVVEEQHKRKNK